MSPDCKYCIKKKTKSNIFVLNPSDEILFARSKKIFPQIWHLSPPLELNLVFSKLMAPPFEPIHEATLQHQTWKVGFLITSARRVNNLQALSSIEPYTIFHHNRDIFRTSPKVLPKVDSDSHINQAILQLAFFPNASTSTESSLHSMDVRRVLKFYLDGTHNIGPTVFLF